MNMTAGTSEYPFRQRHVLAMPALAACLGCVGRVDFHQVPASFFRFARQLREKRRPRGICNALGQTMIVNHPLHMEVFDTDHPETVDDLPTVLMGEVLPSKLHPFMDTRYYLAMLPSFRGPLRQFGVLTLHFGKGFLFRAHEARIGYLLSIGESGKGFQSDIDPHSSAGCWQACWFCLTRERSIPFAGTALVDGERFDLPADRTMVDHLDRANLGEAHPLVVGDAKARLGKGETII